MSNPMNFIETEYKYLKQAMGYLLGAFIWENSPQGKEYWAEVHNNLRLLDEEFAKYVMEKSDE